MRTIRRTTQFRRDIRRAVRRGQDLNKLKEVVEQLVQGDPLDEKYRDHVLAGPYKGARDCHLEPDWLLIYPLTDDDVVLIRTGTHSDLF